MTIKHLEINGCQVSVDDKHFILSNVTDAKDMYIILSDLLRENLLLESKIDKLNSENKMLKNYNRGNESYINRLTHKSDWKNTAHTTRRTCLRPKEVMRW